MQNATQKSQKVFVHVPSEIAAHEVEEIGKLDILGILFPFFPLYQLGSNISAFTSHLACEQELNTCLGMLRTQQLVPLQLRFLAF